LQAGNVLDRIGEASRPSLPDMKQVLEKVGEGNSPSSYPYYLNRILNHAVSVLEGKAAAFAYPKPETLKD
jgi:hypothetical protein